MEIAEASSLLQHHDDLATTHPVLSKHWPNFPPEAPPHARDLKLRVAFAALDPDALALMGGDKFPPLPIHEVTA